MREIIFWLYDKHNNLVGHEIHKPNEYGVMQVYHRNSDTAEKLVRNGYYIPHHYKEVCKIRR